MAAAPALRSPRTGRAFLVLLLCVAALEGAPYLIAPIAWGGAFSRSAILDALRDTVGTYGQELGRDDEEEYLGGQLVHPYLGFVTAPHPHRNRFGLPGDDPLAAAEPGTLHLCIAGGSVAMGVHTFGLETLEAGLRRHPAWRQARFRCSVLALGGTKQPQALQGLSWFMAQGARYDLVINLDGFNEVVLPWCDNRPFGVHPSFPRHWNMYARKTVDNRLLGATAAATAARQRRGAIRDQHLRAPWRWSNAALLVWQARDRRAAAQEAQAESRARAALAETAHDPRTHGPAIAVADTADYLATCADLWANASVQMHRLVHGQGGRYHHFLQPNQYVPGSKPMGRAERATAVEEGPFCYRDAVELGYPLLMERGAQLATEGVHFEDLTGLFRTETKPVYSDKCCHFTPEGYRMLARHMASSIVAAMGPGTPVNGAAQPR
jgi:hypothetical protein